MNRLYQHFDLNQAGATGLIRCVWMQAGVVDYKLCDRSYDCEHCPFDDAFHHADETAAFINDRGPADLINVRGCRLPRNLFYGPQHVWARVEEGGRVRIGLDDFGQNLLGRVYAISLSAPGTPSSPEAPCARLAHQCGISAVVAPLSGKVKEINSRLVQQPSQMNHDPYGQGWFMLIEPSDLKGCLKQLMYGECVSAWLQQEIEKLHLLINSSAGGDAATLNDGGVLTRDCLSGLNHFDRQRVIDSFFPLSFAAEAESNNAIKVGQRR